jgi:hypothetical protein
VTASVRRPQLRTPLRLSAWRRRPRRHGHTRGLTATPHSSRSRSLAQSVVARRPRAAEGELYRAGRCRTARPSAAWRPRPRTAGPGRDRATTPSVGRDVARAGAATAPVGVTMRSAVEVWRRDPVRHNGTGDRHEGAVLDESSGGPARGAGGHGNAGGLSELVTHGPAPIRPRRPRPGTGRSGAVSWGHRTRGRSSPALRAAGRPAVRHRPPRNGARGNQRGGAGCSGTGEDDQGRRTGGDGDQRCRRQAQQGAGDADDADLSVPMCLPSASSPCSAALSRFVLRRSIARPVARSPRSSRGVLRQHPSPD